MKRILSVIMCFVLSLGMIPVESLTLEVFALDDPSPNPEADYISFGQSSMEFYLESGFDPQINYQTLDVWNFSNEKVSFTCECDDFTVACPDYAIPSDSKATVFVTPDDSQLPKNHKPGNTFQSVLVFTFEDKERNLTYKSIDITVHYAYSSEFYNAICIMDGDTFLDMSTVVDFGTLPRNYTEEDIPEARKLEIFIDPSEYECGWPINVYRPRSDYFKIGELEKGEETFNYTTRLLKDETVSFTVQPKSGYPAGGHYEEVVAIEFDDLRNQNPKTVYITLSFDVAKEGNETHNISVISYGNGSALADNRTSVTARAGSIVQLVAEPKDRYFFKKWEIVGVDEDDLDQYIKYPKSRMVSLVMGDSDIVVKAVFEEIPNMYYKIDASAVLGGGFAHGSVWADPPYARKGDEVVITGIPDYGYRLVKHELRFEGDESATVVRDTLNFRFAAEDGGYEDDLPLYVQSTFEKIPNSVSIQSFLCGFATVKYKGCRFGDKESDPYYIDGSLTATPFSGYEFVRWDIKGNDVNYYSEGIVDSKERFNPKAHFYCLDDSNVSISALFRAIDYNVTINVEGHGKAEAVKTYGASVYNIVLTPDPGAKYKSVSIQSGAVPVGGMGIALIDKNAVLKAVFEDKETITPEIGLNDWTYGEKPDTLKLGGYDGEGKVSYSFFLNEGCTMATTPENSGASYRLGIPANAGSYFLKVLVGETVNHKMGTATAEFTINPKELTDSMLSLDKSKFMYSKGTTHKPSLTLNDNGKELVSGKDYDIVEDESTLSAEDIGTYTIKVEGKGNYTGTAQIEWSVRTETPPLLSISIGNSKWNRIISPVSFNLFFNSAQNVNVTASTDTGTIKDVWYYIDSSGSAVSSSEDIEKLVSDGWISFSGVSGNTFSGSVSLLNEEKYVVYVRAEDSNGFKSYASTNGIVIDLTPPVISGVENGKDYNTKVSFTAADIFLSALTLKNDGSGEVKEFYAHEGEASGSAEDFGSYLLTAEDMAGNRTTCSFSISKETINIKTKDKFLVYFDEPFDVSQLFVIPDSAGKAEYIIVSGDGAGTGEGVLEGNMLTVTKAGTIYISVTTAATDYMTSASAIACVTVARVRDTEDDEKEKEDFSHLERDITDEDGNSDAEVKLEKKKDGSTETTIIIDGQEIEKTVTDTEGLTTSETGLWIGGLKESYPYTGSAIEPEIHVYDGTKMLIQGVDFDLRFKNNKKPGTDATVTVNFKGIYGKESKAAGFNIRPAVIGKDVLVADFYAGETGKEQKPVPAIVSALTGDIIPSKYFEYTYKDDKGNGIKSVKAQGSYQVSVKPKKKNNGFTGEVTAKLTVTDADRLMSGVSVLKLSKQYTYTGRAIVPECELMMGEKQLVKGKDYDVSVVNNEDPGTAVMTFTAIDGNEKGLLGSKTVSFKIVNGRMLTKEPADGFSYIYNDTAPYEKGGAKPAVVVKDGEITLKEGEDYTVKYSKNNAITDGKTAAATVKGKGRYKGSVSLGFAVTARNIATLSENVLVGDKTKTKSPDGYKNPSVTVTDLNGKKLKAGKDYKLDGYSEPDKNGKVTVSLMGTGAYNGSLKISYRYIDGEQALSKVSVFSNISPVLCTGKEITLSDEQLQGILYTGEVYDWNFLVPGKDFEVQGYSNNISPGTAKVTLHGIGDYGSTLTLKFRINPRGTDNYKGVLVNGKWTDNSKAAK